MQLVPFVAALLPVLVYWPTLTMWFRADDFAWLSLGTRVPALDGWLEALFAPRAQGTVRFLSERLFFITFWKAAGLDALPYRAAVLAGLCGSSWFLFRIVQRTLGQDWAALVAVALWLVQAGLGAAMGWLSSANQVWCSLFAFATLWAFIERRRAFSWALLIAGFGTLETMIVVPLVAVAWSIEFRRESLSDALWLCLPAVAFGALHAFAIPKLATDPAYHLHFDLPGLLDGVATYWTWGSGTMLGAAALVAVLVPAAFRSAAVRWGLVLLAAGLAPVLPLRDHREWYYLAFPGAGLAIALTGAIAASAASISRLRWPWRLVVMAAAALFVSGHAVRLRDTLAWHAEKTAAVRVLVRGVVAARQIHPNKVILLTGVSNQLFWDGVFDDPFLVAGVDRVRLAPGAETPIDAHPEWGGIHRWVTTPKAARDWVVNRTVVIYQPAGSALQNITSVWVGQFAP